MPNEHLSDLGVNLIGYTRAEMGLGTAARGIAHALESASIPFNILNFEQGNPSLHRDDSWKHKEVNSSAYDFTLMVINPDNIVNAVTQVQKKSVKDRYTIGYWFWELPELPESWLARFPLVDEVWAASRFIQDAVSLKSPVPVFRVPLPIKLGAADEFTRKDFSLPEGKFLFLSMSDVQSQLTRKNPLGVVRAFKKAFPGNDNDVGLVLRINNLNTIHGDQEAINQLNEEIAGSHNIHILDVPMTRAEIDALLAVTDCFVSLHRSEGFGLGPAEAMSLGKPVMLTKWSGNTDYMTSANSVGIDYQLIPVGKQYGPYQPEQVWADPDLEQAAFWMKRLAKEPELAQKIGRLGQKTIESEFSPAAVGKLIRKRLDYLRRRDRPPLQVFVPQQGTYLEASSHVTKFRPRAWQCVKVLLARGLGDGSARIRIDPGNKSGIIDLAAISLRSTSTRKLLWRLKTGVDLQKVKVAGTATALAHDRLLRLASFGEDPQVFLPPLAGPQFKRSLVLEVWIRLDSSPELIAMALEKDAVLRLNNIASLKQECSELRSELRQVRDEQRRALTLFEENLVLLKRERGELLRERGEQMKAHWRLEQETAMQHRELASLQERLTAMSAALENSRRAVREQRVRRADVTSRLKRREHELRHIQRSLAWKAVKPLWKLGRHFAEKAPAAEPPRIAFEIDSPTTWDEMGDQAAISGWCFYPTGEQIVGVRARIGRKTYLGQYGLERSDVATVIGHGTVARNSGFRIDCPIPAEPSTLVVEAIVQGDQWKPFFQRTIMRKGSARRVAATRVATSDQVDKAAEFEVAKRQLAAVFATSARTSVNTTPRFSVITPTYNTRARWLIDAAKGLVSQSYSDWEWCIVDDGSSDPYTLDLLKALAELDPRIRIELKENAGISSATNHAMKLARGEFVCFMDHDDWLAPEAFAVVSRKIEGGFDVVYSDEDKYDELSGRLVESFHKPDWSPEYLRGVMYVGHLLTVRRALAQRIGFDTTFDGIQDFDFMLRVGETGAAIGHVPQILYHWRKTPGSIAADSNAKVGIDLLQKKAVDAHLARLGLPAQAEIRGGHRLGMLPHRKTNPPVIGIIIPTKDSPELIGRCLETLYRLTSYPRYEVIIMDNGTTDKAALKAMNKYPVKRVQWRGDFNFSHVNNVGIEHTSAPYLVFLNNDTEIVTPDWLQYLLYYAEQPDVGAAGPLLLYPNRTVQHAGVALGMRGTADHLMRGFPANVEGYAGSLSCAREVSAVTAACLMISRQRFEEVGKFDELFSTLYQDVDLCLRLRQRLLRIIYTPEAVLIHHESASRKSYYDMVDRMFLLDQWDTLIEKGDPYYNPNFNLERGDYSMATRG